MDSPCMISMEFSTAGRDDCYFRIKAGKNVKYVTVQAGALDAEALLDMPLDFQNILPSLPYNKDGWTQAYISRNAASGELEAELAQSDLPGVQTIWHPDKVNFLDLERTEQLSMLAQECLWKRGLSNGNIAPEVQGQRTVIAKIARFAWEIQYIEAETKLYQVLQSCEIAPRFLGHVYEGDRVIGFILEKVEGRSAASHDLASCEAALRRLHGLGVLHGDCNRYNFIVGTDGKVTLIDFEKARVGASADEMEEEVNSLVQQLREETGRGAGFGIRESE